jgi:hypothetical protein
VARATKDTTKLREAIATLKDTLSKDEFYMGFNICLNVEHLILEINIKLDAQH